MEHKAIAIVPAYRINDNDLYHLYEKYYKTENVFSHLLPWTINKNESANNQPIRAEHFLQFAGQFKPENSDEYILFDIETSDEFLSEEISQCGVEEIFKDTDLAKIFSNFDIPMYEEVGNRLRAPIYLLVDIEYTGGYDYYTGDSDLEVNIQVTGYLDTHNLDKVLF